MNSFQEICNKHAPIKSLRVKNRHNPWITKDIVNVMYERDYAHRKSCESKDPKLRKTYTNLRNQVTNAITLAKKEYFENVQDNFKGNTKHLWKELRRVIGDKKKDNPVPASMSSNKLNDFFANVGSKIHEKLPNPGQLNWKNPECIYTFDFDRIEESCVLNHLLKLSKDTHLDPLDMDVKLLYISANIIAPSVTQLMNVSLETGDIPADWKIARISPVYKGKGSKWDDHNYRPISVLPTFSIIIEREVQKQMMEYFIKHQLISIDQFAFLKDHSTMSCLHRIIDEWLEAISNNEYVFFLFL